MNEKLTPSEQVEAEIRARLNIESEKSYELVERPITGVEERRLVAKLKKDLERLRKTRQYKARWRNRIVTKMYAWGEWATSSGASSALGSTPLGVAIRRAEQNEIAIAAIGYERGLSDYESMMITIDSHVSAMNRSDRDLLVLAYQVMGSDMGQIWESMYGKREGRYRRRKSELLRILSDRLEAI